MNIEEFNYSEFIFIKHIQKYNLMFDDLEELVCELNDLNREMQENENYEFDFIEVDLEKILRFLQRSNK